MFRGGRPASRYELAVALYALYQHLSKMNDSMSKSIKDLEEKMGGGTDTSGFASKAELQAVKDQLASMKSGLDSMRGWGDEIANFKKNLDALKGDLASMGVDVEALKKGLGDLDARVKKLEGMKMPVEISGDVNLWLGGGYSDDRHWGLTVDGRPVGVGQDGRPTGFTHDLTILHEAGITLKGTNEEGPKWKATLVHNNMMSYGNYPIDVQSSVGFGSMNSVLPGTPFSEGSGDTFIENLEVMYSTSLLGQKFDMRVGRIGKQTGAYFFKRQDSTPYYDNERWDNGDYIFDGADFKFGFGKGSLSIFGGRVNSQLTNNGTPINTVVAGAVGHPVIPGGSYRPYGNGNGLLVGDGPIGYAVRGFSMDQFLGTQLNIPLSDKGGVNLNYMIFDSNTNYEYNVTPPKDGNDVVFMNLNRVNVFGGDINYKFGDVMFRGGYSQSNLAQDSTTTLDEDNYAWWASFSYQKEKWGAAAGYRQILPQFGAPGSWGRIGIWWNPTDIEGFFVSGWTNLTDRVKIGARGDFYQGTNTTLQYPVNADGNISYNQVGLTNDDKINRFLVDLEYDFKNNWKLWLGAEFVDWKLAARDEGIGSDFKPRERWYNIGLDYKLSDKASWSIWWQISDYDSKGMPGFNPFINSQDQKAKGGWITSQLSIRF